MSPIQYPLPTFPPPPKGAVPREPGDLAFMTRPQSLNHPRAGGMPGPAGARPGVCVAGVVRFLHRAQQAEQRALPGCQLPRKPHTCYTRAVGRLKATATAVQSAYHFIPCDRGGDQSAGLPSRIWEHSPRASWQEQLGTLPRA